MNSEETRYTLEDYADIDRLAEKIIDGLRSNNFLNYNPRRNIDGVPSKWSDVYFLLAKNKLKVKDIIIQCLRKVEI